MKLINKSDYKFIDISSEEWRRYIFDNNKVVVIAEPIYLSVSDSGHRILEKGGISHFIPKGWIQLSWKAKQDQPHFVK